MPLVLMKVVSLGHGIHVEGKNKGAWKVQPLGTVQPIPAEEQSAALETFHAIAAQVARTEVVDEN